jgi:hypothetical protein
MGVPFGAALLLGAVLAPTDPVLAADVGLLAPGGEVYGKPRLSLDTEAGFNDGLASPFVVLALLVAERGGSGWLLAPLLLLVIRPVLVLATTNPRLRACARESSSVSSESAVSRPSSLPLPSSTPTPWALPSSTSWRGRPSPA